MQPIEKVVSALTRRGCLDLTLSIDPTTCSDLLGAEQGFYEVYRAMLRDGTRIAIKATRIYDGPEADSEGDSRKRRKLEVSLNVPVQRRKTNNQEFNVARY